MTTSVVIAAHNEADVIDRTLATLLADAAPDEFDVVVACNGCTDDTAARARAVGAPVRVLELEQASKVAALRAGDEAAGPGDRLYLDADIDLPTRAARELVEALQRPGVLAASTTLRLDTEAASRGVRSYMRIWRQLPSVDRGLSGRGVYAISTQGRERFDEFPDVIADDRFIDQLYADFEREIVASSSTVRVPRTLSTLIRNKTRIFLGNRRLASDTTLEVGGGRAGDPTAWLGVVRRSPALTVHLPVYLYVTISAKLRARRQDQRGDSGWSRDATSRSAA